jgi:twitching motility two-component system response regulator PilH
VDDSMAERELMGKVVRHLGHEPFFADNGEAAVTMVMNTAYDLILMDVVMPGGDGFSTCRRLKRDSATKDIPIVLVTSKGHDIDKFWGQQQGANAYVVKPFKPDDLMKVIQRFI